MAVDIKVTGYSPPHFILQPGRNRKLSKGKQRRIFFLFCICLFSALIMKSNKI